MSEHRADSNKYAVGYFCMQLLQHNAHILSRNIQIFYGHSIQRSTSVSQHPQLQDFVGAMFYHLNDNQQIRITDQTIKYSTPMALLAASLYHMNLVTDVTFHAAMLSVA